MKKVFVSDKLKEVLTEFENESVVARLLLGKDPIEGELVDDYVNYISISDQDMTKISYLSTDRIEKINKQYSPEAGYSSLMVDKALWESPIRFHARPGSFITKIFKNISPKEVEKFSNLYRANVNKPKFKFKVVSGNDIHTFYHYENYAGEGRGTLGNSCMKHDGCQKFLNIYSDHKDVVSMLCMLNEDGLLMGRALLWHWESYKIMDRIYTICDEDLAFYFKKWATDNGYLYKSEQNWYNTMQFESLNNKKQELKLDIKLNNVDYRYFPYVDTFKWIDLQAKTIHNYIPSADKANIRTLAASDGGKLEWDYIILDGLDNMHRYRNECGFVEYKNIWTYQGNLNFSDINNKWILCKDAKFDEELGDYIFGTEYDHLNNKPVIEQRRKDILARRERRKEEEKKREREREIFNFIHNTDYSDIISQLPQLGIEETLRRIVERQGVQESEPTSPEPVVESNEIGEDDVMFSFDYDYFPVDAYRVTHSEPTPVPDSSL